MKTRMLATMILATTGLVSSLAHAGQINGGMVVLNPSAEGALTMSGNGRTESIGIWVNSTSANAVVASGNAEMDTSLLAVRGGTSFSGNATCTGTIDTGVEAATHPFTAIVNETPNPGEEMGKLKLSGGLHLVNPGYYDGGIQISGKATVQLLPGTYYVGGSGIKLSGGTIAGEGVVFVVLEGDVDVSAQTVMTLSAPDDGPFAGMTIYQPTSNDEGMSLSGGSGMTISGALCAPGGTITLTGSSSVAGAGAYFGDLVVADKVRLAGNGNVKVGQGEFVPMDSVVLPGAKLMYD